MAVRYRIARTAGTIMLQAVMLGFGVVAVGLALALVRGALSGVDRLFAAGLVVLALVFGWLAFSDPLAGDTPIASARARSATVLPVPAPAARPSALD